MANHNYFFTPEIDSELNELRIDSIRENKEMTEQQIVINLIHEKFISKHGSKNAAAVEENEADDEYSESNRNTDECWTTRDALAYINDQTKRQNSISVIYSAINNGEINFVCFGRKHYFKPEDVKKWFHKHKNHKTAKTTLPPPIQKKERKKRVFTEEQLNKMRERATHARMFIGKPKQETIQCATN